MTFHETIPDVSVVANIFLFMSFVDGFPTMYTFGKTCSLEPHQMNEDSTFYLSFYTIGRPRDLWCSYMAFSGQGSNSKDRYRICIIPKKFSDPVCSLKLTLRNSLNGSVLRTFSCMEYAESTFCAKQGENLFFEAEFYETDKEVPSEFIFHVEATRTYDHMATVAGITGGSIGLFLILLLAIVIKLCKMKVKNRPLTDRFKSITGARFFCTRCDQESNSSSTTANSGSSERSCAVTSASRQSQPTSLASSLYVVSDTLHVSTNSSNSILLDPGFRFTLYNPRTPPPYQEEDNLAFDPLPEYSSLNSL